MPGARPSRTEILTALFWTIVRVALSFLLIGLMLTLLPDVPDGRFAVPLVLAIVMTSLYIWYFRRQLSSVYKAKFPTLRAVEALILVATMFLAIFSMFYVLISVNDRGAFTEPLDAFTGYYFSLTVLATVGFGDITPVTSLARSVTMVQMALDLAFIGVAIKVIGGAARSALQARHEAPDMKTTAEVLED